MIRYSQAKLRERWRGIFEIYNKVLLSVSYKDQF